MSLKEVIILGCAGNHLDVLEILEEQRECYQCIGFLDDKEEMQGKSFQGLPVLGKLIENKNFPQCLFVNSIAGYKSHRRRDTIAQQNGIEESKFISLVSSKASISKFATIGCGSVILAGSIVAANAKLGKQVFMFQSSVVNHDTRVGDYSIIASNVGIAGGCQIGKNVYLGVGSNVRDEIMIGDYSLVGMGSTIVHQIPSNVMVYGSPAKIKMEKV